MKSLKRIVLLCVWTGLFGCATSDIVEYEPVQVVQAKDPALNCAELQAEILRMETAITDLTNQIGDHKSGAQTVEMAETVNNATGSYNPFSGMVASMSRESAMEKREVRDSYQRRRDSIMQQYFAKDCVASTMN